MLVHRRVIPSMKFPSTHLYTWVERGTVRVNCLAQEHNTMSPAIVHSLYSLRMLRTNPESKITRSQPRCSRQYVTQAFFNLRSERKHFLWRWYCHKKHKNVKIEICFIAVCTLIDNEYASLLFHIVSACWLVWTVGANRRNKAAFSISGIKNCITTATNRWECRILNRPEKF